nr:thiamine-phosphate kinase [Bacillus sp. SM2101]
MSVIDEFSLINKIKPQVVNQSSLIMGIGDDAALVSSQDKFDQIICIDTMVEEVHFKRSTMKPYQIGFKALAANISDVAAMGGIPLYYLISIAIPKHWTEEDILVIYAGMNDLARNYDMDMIGGDTVSTNGPLVISVTVIGEVEKGKKLFRSNAKDGDIVFVTGTLGDSSAGLQLLLAKGIKYSYQLTEKELVNKHQMPYPRVEIGRLLTCYNRVALNDISDGLASEANEIAEASNVSIYLEEGQIPLSKQIYDVCSNEAIIKALYGGEDYELIGTLPQSDWNHFEKECLKHNYKVTAIGQVKSGPSEVLLQTNDGKVKTIEKKGYNHFNN